MFKTIILASVMAAILAPVSASAQFFISGGHAPPLAAYAGPGTHMQDVKECHNSPLFGKVCEIVAIRSVPADAPDTAEYGTTRPTFQMGQVRFGRHGITAQGYSYAPAYSQGFGHADYHGW